MVWGDLRPRVMKFEILWLWLHWYVKVEARFQDLEPSSKFYSSIIANVSDLRQQFYRAKVGERLERRKQIKKLSAFTSYSYCYLYFVPCKKICLDFNVYKLDFKFKSQLHFLKEIKFWRIRFNERKGYIFGVTNYIFVEGSYCCWHCVVKTLEFVSYLRQNTSWASERNTKTICPIWICK